MTDTPTPEQVLALPMRENPADAATIRDYLTGLLANLWREGSDFNSKRPYGYSDWQFTVYQELVRAGWVPGEFDDDGHLATVDVAAADRLMDAAIRHLGGGA